MTPQQQLAVAISLAAERHVNQFDKAGQPYILHPLKVMYYLKTTDLELMAIAVLHDVIEDTKTTYSELAEFGFSLRVIAGVKALTKLPGQTAEEYMTQVKTNVDAIYVKLSDLRHNSDIRRLKGITVKDMDRVNYYMRMHTMLTDHLKGIKSL